MPGLQIFLPSLDLPTFTCRNCGFWQRYHHKPDTCPVCTDYRHILPPKEWLFYDLNEALEAYPMKWEELLPGLWHFWNDPVEGIGSHSYLIQNEKGNVVFEGATVYSQAALEKMTQLGGVSLATGSHAHTYGALWQLQDHFDASVALHVDDLNWSNAFRVTHPFENQLKLNDDLQLIHAGIHFEGQSFMYSNQYKIIFCGDAMKFDLDQDDLRSAVGISSHKSFVRSIPLSQIEIDSYVKIFSQFKFERVYSPFEQVHNVNSSTITQYFKELSDRYPFVDFISLK